MSDPLQIPKHEPHEPHDPRQCPACGSPLLVHGSLDCARSGDSENHAAHFKLRMAKRFTLSNSARLMASHRFFGCLACDLVWSNAVPGQLAQIVELAGSDELKQDLAKRSGS